MTAYAVVIKKTIKVIIMAFACHGRRTGVVVQTRDLEVGAVTDVGTASTIVAIKADQRPTISPVAAIGCEVTVVHTAAVTTVVRGDVAGVICNVIDVIEHIVAGSMAISTKVSDSAGHMHNMTGAAGARNIRVVVTGGAIVDAATPDIVGDTVAIVRRVTGTIFMTVVGAAGTGNRAVVGKGNTTAAEGTDIVGSVNMLGVRGSACRGANTMTICTVDSDTKVCGRGGAGVGRVGGVGVHVKVTHDATAEGCGVVPLVGRRSKLVIVAIDVGATIVNAIVVNTVIGG